MNDKLRRFYCSEIITYIYEEFNGDYNHDIDLFLTNVLPCIMKIHLNIDGAIEILEKCPKLFKLIGFIKHDNKYNIEPILLNAYNLIVRDDSLLLETNKLVDQINFETNVLDNRNINYHLLYFKDISNIPLLTHEETKCLFEKYNNSNGELKNLIKQEIIVHNLKLVVSIAKKYYFSKREDILDLIEEGNLGLIKAVERYDYKKGFTFANYAKWWIMESILRYKSKNSKAAKVPLYVIDYLNKHDKCVREKEKSSGQIPTYEELSQTLNIKSEKVKEFSTLFLNPVSLDSPVFGSEELTFGDTIATKNDEINELIDKLTFENIIEDIRNDPEINERNKEIFFSRFGVEGYKRKSISELGEKYNLCRSRIDQIEKFVINRVRKKHNRE